MQAKKWTIGLSVAFTLTLGSGAMAGGVVTFNGDGDGTNWGDRDNWDTNAVPAADDRAKIPTGFTGVVVNGNFTVDTIEILGTGHVTIQKGKTLTLQNDDHIIHICVPLQPNCVLSDDSIIDGKLTLEGDATKGSTLAFTTKTHRLNGTGGIVGQKVKCKISIASAIVLTNILDDGIRGSMEFDGAGTFNNASLLESDEEIIIDCEVDDTSSASWVTGCGDAMQFNNGSTSLLGDFSEGSATDEGRGTFTFLETVATCGTYRSHCGSVFVISPVTFEYAEFEDLSGSCSNPGTGGDDTCDNLWVIDTLIYTPCL